jgi:hypothetical protein
MKTTVRSEQMHDTVRTKSRKSLFRIGLIVSYVVTFAVLIGFFVDGFSYYSTPYLERPRNILYRQFRPAGTWGLVFGVIGAVMLTMMLAYTVRKRSKFLRRVGELPTWLNLHIYLGITGPLFIILHTSFKVKGLVAVSFWSMILVALSGYFGRYLYIQIPRNIQGNELSLNELDEIRDSLTQLLLERYDVNNVDAMERLDRLAKVTIPEEAGLFKAFMFTIGNDIRWFAMSRALRKEFSLIIDLPKKQLRYMMELARERSLLQRRIALMSRAQQLFHYWHVIHKPFAFVMYVVMAIHIAVAIWTGYARIF